MFQHTAGPGADANLKEHLGSKSAEELRAELDALFEKEEMEGVMADPNLVAAYDAALKALEPDPQTQPPGTFEESWATFTNNHPDLFPKEKPKSRNRSTLRRSLEAIVLVAVLLVASGTAFDWPDYVVTWGKELLQISPAVPSSGVMELPEPNSDGYSTLEEAIIDIGAIDANTPTWIPEQYQIQTIKVQKASIYQTATAIYIADNSELMIRISYYSEISLMPSVNFEKDEGTKQTEKTPSGISYQLSENFGTLRITWENGHCIYSMSGKISQEDAERIVDSFYGG